MAVRLDLEQLRTFLTIAETGSFTRAAEIVSRTQPAISMQMRLLEDALGKSIFERDGHGCRLTEEGERLYAHAQQMVRLSGETIAAFGEGKASERISFGIPDDYAVRFLPAILERAAISLPDVEISVVCESSDTLVEMVWAGDLDVAIVTNGSPGRFPVVREEPLVWVASAAHRIEREEILPLVVAGPICIWRKSAVSGLTAVGRKYRVAYVSTNATVTKATVLAGLAVGVMTESSVWPGMRILGQADGLPALPLNQVGLARSWREPSSSAVDALCNEISALLRRPHPEVAEARLA
jgi:DNA-binding transcriptional LysR family regulator